MKNLSINPQIIDICKEHSLDSEVVILVLLAHYFNVIPDSLKTVYEEEIKAVYFLGIVTPNEDFTSITNWNIPLFNGDTIADDWAWVISEYRPLFTNRRKDAGGTIASCIDKMKKFFAENPSIRKDDVMEAAKLYIKKNDNPMYLQKANYFINKNKNESRLLEYLEIIKLQEKKVTEVDKYNKIH